MTTQFSNKNVGNRNINKVVWFEQGKECSEQSEFTYDNQNHYNDEFNLWCEQPPVNVDGIDNNEYEVRQFVQGISTPVAIYNSKEGFKCYPHDECSIQKAELAFGA